MSQTGNGTTITFVPAGFTARYRQVGSLREYHNTIDLTGLDSDYEDMCAAAVRRNDPIDCELFWDTDWNLNQSGTKTGPPLGDNAQSVIITYPPKTGQTNGAKRTATAVVTEVTSPALANDQELSGSYQLKFTAFPAHTVGS